jgi:hypothetical protein
MAKLLLNNKTMSNVYNKNNLEEKHDPGFMSFLKFRKHKEEIINEVYCYNAPFAIKTEEELEKQYII